MAGVTPGSAIDVVLGVAVNVGEAGAVGVGEYLAGGVFVGFATELAVEGRFGAMAWVFVILSIMPINENSRSVRDNIAKIAREVVDLTYPGRADCLRVLYFRVVFFIFAFPGRHQWRDGHLYLRVYSSKGKHRHSGKRANA